MRGSDCGLGCLDLYGVRVAGATLCARFGYSTCSIRGMPEDVEEGLQASRFYWLSNGSFMHDCQGRI